MGRSSSTSNRRSEKIQKQVVKAIKEYEADPSRENEIRYAKALNKLQLYLERR